METVTKVTAIKRFFDNPEVTTKELIELRKGDTAAFDWLAEESAKQLGVQLESK